MVAGCMGLAGAIIRRPVDEQMAGSGRSRSGTSRCGVPMWMKPAMRSSSTRPSSADDVVVGRPAGQPLRAKATGLRGLEQGKADAGGARSSARFRGLAVLAQAAITAMTTGRMGKAVAILVDGAIAGLRVALQRARGQRSAQRVARARRSAGIARHALAMVGNAHRGASIAARWPGRARAAAAAGTDGAWPVAQAWGSGCIRSQGLRMLGAGSQIGY